MIIVRGPSTRYTKYGWLCILLDWTNSTRHYLITRNLWPKPEITINQELNTRPMHDKPWGTELNSWKSHGTAATSKTWAESSAKLTTPRSISTAATMDRSTISYDPYLSTHVFTKLNIDAPKPTDSIWIGVSHVFLPTFWCAKRNSWSSHHDKIHDERIRWQSMKDAQIAKQVEYRKQNQQNHYGPPQQQDRKYGRNDNNKRSNTTYGRDNYQDKRSRNDCGRSPSRDRSNSHTRSPRSPGDNHRNSATFYYDKKKY
jgi:hypothetical protein